MVFNATFNNITVISWLSVLLVEKTTDLPQVTDKSYHRIVHRVHLATLQVIGTDCTDSCKPSYHTITTATTPYIEAQITKYIQ
jgi:hypothetical protein